jgi:hypothetical protein
MNILINLSPQQLRRAADVKERIDTLRNELNELLGSPVQAGDGSGSQRRKRRMSAAGRAAIAAAARARWARIRGTAPAVTTAPKGRRKMSAAARARLAAIARARWRKVKAQGKSAL